MDDAAIHLLSDNHADHSPPARKRADSQVRFADQLWNSDPVPANNSLAPPFPVPTGKVSSRDSNEAFSAKSHATKLPPHLRPPKPGLPLGPKVEKTMSDPLRVDSDPNLEEWLKGYGKNSNSTSGNSMKEVQKLSVAINSSNADDSQVSESSEILPSPLKGDISSVSLSESFQRYANLSAEENRRFEHETTYREAAGLFDSEDPVMRESPLLQVELSSEQQYLLSNNALHRSGYSSASNNTKDDRKPASTRPN
jgi:hypothetical protein